MEETSLQKSVNENLIYPIEDQRDNAIWVITYGIKNYYLTHDEKEAFLDALSKGVKWVDIRGNILTDKFLTISLDVDMYDFYKRQTRNNEKYSKDGRLLNPTDKEFFKPDLQETPEQKVKRGIKREELREVLRQKGILKN